MKISFVIPAYNEEASIAECLESIITELQHSPCDAEIIVVNNASTDNTKNIAQSMPGVRVVDESKKGLVWARLAGHNASTGDIVANIDSDVRLTSGWLNTVMSEFQKDPELVALSGPFIYHDLPAIKRAMVKVFYAMGFAVAVLTRVISGRGALLQGGNFVVRREALERAGGYNTSITFYGEDTDIALKMSTVGKVKWTFALSVYSSARRIHGEGIIASSARYTINFLWMMFFGRPFSHAYKDFRPK